MPKPPFHPAPTRVILVRHGQSTYNAQGLYQGCSDASVLTPAGRLMAYRIGIALDNLSISTLYTSPLQRAQATAAEILAALKTKTTEHPLPKVLVHPLLKEIALPHWEGLPIQSVKEQFAQDYQCWREQPHTFQMVPPAPQAEEGVIATLAPATFPVQNLYAQARQFWQDVLPQHRGKTLLVVSHGGTIRALIGTALHQSPAQSKAALPPEAYFHHLQQSNGGISILTVSANPHQPAQLEAMNLTQHLGETLPKLKEGKTGLRLLLVAAESGNNPQHQTLEDYLSQIPIAFCIRNTESGGAIAKHPKILNAQLTSANILTTGLVVATPADIQALINPILGLPPQPTAVSIKPGTVSLLHYPAAVKQPILQALNISGHGFPGQTIPTGRSEAPNILN
jgi:probable phosphoglycerate mutase